MNCYAVRSLFGDPKNYKSGQSFRPKHEEIVADLLYSSEELDQKYVKQVKAPASLEVTKFMTDVATDVETILTASGSITNEEILAVQQGRAVNYKMSLDELRARFTENEEYFNFLLNTFNKVVISEADGKIIQEVKNTLTYQAGIRRFLNLKFEVATDDEFDVYFNLLNGNNVINRKTDHITLVNRSWSVSSPSTDRVTVDAHSDFTEIFPAIKSVVFSNIVMVDDVQTISKEAVLDNELGPILEVGFSALTADVILPSSYVPTFDHYFFDKKGYTAHIRYSPEVVKKAKQHVAAKLTESRNILGNIIGPVHTYPRFLKIVTI